MRKMSQCGPLEKLSHLNKFTWVSTIMGCHIVLWFGKELHTACLEIPRSLPSQNISFKFWGERAVKHFQILVEIDS